MKTGKMLALAAALLSVQVWAEAIKVGYISLPAHGANFIAKERGYFAEQALEAEMVRFQSAQQMAVAIASGDVDYGITSITGGLLNLAARGDAVRIFGGSLMEDPSVEGQVILVSNQAYEEGLQSPKDLAGKRWAVTTAGSSFSYMGGQIAAAAGADAKSLKMIPFNGIPTITAALSTGQVDAWSIQPAIAQRLIDKGEAKVIGKVADYLPDYQVTVLFTSTKNVQEKPNQVKGFKTAYARAIADYNKVLVEHQGEAAEIDAVVAAVHKYVHSDEPLEKARELILQNNMKLSEGAALNRADALKQIEWFKAEGSVPANLEGEKILTPDAHEAAQ